MSSESKNKKTLPWESSVEKFEGIIVALLAFFLVLIILTVTVVASYLFASKLTTVASVSNISELQQAAMRAFSGILLVLLALELLDTVKVYFREHVVRVEENLRARGITLWLAAVNPDLLKIIEHSPLGAALGRERMFFNLRKALEAWQQRSERPTFTNENPLPFGGSGTPK